jgi:uncharacterized protein YggE
MRHHLLSLVALAVATTASTLRAQETVPGRALVSTVGSAEIRAVPDLADLIFQVEVRNADLSKARKEQAERVSKVLGALRHAGIAESDLQTSQAAIVPHYDDRDTASPATGVVWRQESATVRFYSVSQDISCTLRDIKKVPNVTADALEAGVTGIPGASLRTSELRKYRDQARTKAVRAAKEKAVALATELGAKVGRPYAITENQTYDATPSFGPNYAQVSQSGGARLEDNAEPAFAPGTISVGASVNVSFILE